MPDAAKNILGIDIIERILINRTFIDHGNNGIDLEIISEQYRYRDSEGIWITVNTKIKRTADGKYQIEITDSDGKFKILNAGFGHEQVAELFKSSYPIEIGVDAFLKNIKLPEPTES